MENEMIELGTHTKEVINIEDYAMTKENLLKQVHIIEDVMRDVMKENVHYGKAYPGAEKPSLLKPGAEKLNMTFRFAPKEKIERFDLPGGHREYEITCYLYSIVTGAYLGFGTGNCNTMETKYRFRDEERKCPHCRKETIIKGKEQYGGGWLCWAKRGGCGAKFKDDDPTIKDQVVGKVEYDNPADYYNTIKKISKKRALVDAVLTCTAASDMFTQDTEDLEDKDGGIIDVKAEVVGEAEKPSQDSKKPPQSMKGSNKIHCPKYKKEILKAACNTCNEREKCLSWATPDKEKEVTPEDPTQPYKGLTPLKFSKRFKKNMDKILVMSQEDKDAIRAEYQKHFPGQPYPMDKVPEEKEKSAVDDKAEEPEEDEEAKILRLVEDSEIDGMGVALVPCPDRDKALIKSIVCNPCMYKRRVGCPTWSAYDMAFKEE